MNITPYERSHRQRILDLMFHCERVYTHLDWQDTSQWLDTPDAIIYLAWQEHHLQGLMAVSAPLNGTVWLRLAMVDNRANGKVVLDTLWQQIIAYLQQMEVHLAAALVVDDWIINYLPALGFAYQEDIITLSRNSRELPIRKSPAVIIRPAEVEDFPAITRVDQAAFQPPWQMSEQEIRQARRISASCKVAQNSAAGIVGYQLSTLYSQTGHLARLAIVPNMQGVGVASALLEDLIHDFSRRGVQHITVNTQNSNIRSQDLYARYSFQRNGYDLPVWIMTL